jgi:hypothetical protein
VRTHYINSRRSLRQTRSAIVARQEFGSWALFLSSCGGERFFLVAREPETERGTDPSTGASWVKL